MPLSVADLLSPSRVVCQVNGTSKKQVIQYISQLIAEAVPGMDENEIYDTLIGRERLGSTGIGHGVAIPHGRVKSTDRVIGAFIRLEQPIDFDAPDRQPVDLLFAMLVPEECERDHLDLLARLAEMFRDPAFRRTLREVNTPQDLYLMLSEWQPADA